MKATQAHTGAQAFTPFKYALQLAFLLGAGLILSACKPQATADKGADLSGVYSLVSVNGKNLPASVSHDGVALQVRSGAFTLGPDGTCGSKMVFVPPSGKEVTREVSATYTREGAKLTMQWKGAGKTTGTIETNTFTMNNEGMVFVYRK